MFVHLQSAADSLPLEVAGRRPFWNDRIGREEEGRTAGREGTYAAQFLTNCFKSIQFFSQLGVCS